MCNGYRHLRIEHLPVQRAWPVALWLGRQSASQSREALAVLDVAECKKKQVSRRSAFARLSAMARDDPEWSLAELQPLLL
jgi:hypothetical protein